MFYKQLGMYLFTKKAEVVVHGFLLTLQTAQTHYWRKLMKTIVKAAAIAALFARRVQISEC